ncbi:MAG: hypothetical protein CMH30_08860 [Micavibrio sp.]|nr:hypothetical protein [Micavibrio sp.]|tara:strand:+ start:774 stop:1871 length:1098 start_codon:yes stop_codon:yes gene_type:complete
MGKKDDVKEDFDVIECAGSALKGGLIGTFILAVKNDPFGGSSNVFEYFTAILNFSNWPVSVYDQYVSSISNAFENASSGDVSDMALWIGGGAALVSGVNAIGQKYPFVRKAIDTATTAPLSLVETPIRIAAAPIAAIAAVMIVNQDGTGDGWFNYIRHIATNPYTLTAIGGGATLGFFFTNSVYKAATAPISLAIAAFKYNLLKLRNPENNTYKKMWENVQWSVSHNTKKYLATTLLATTTLVGLTCGMQAGYHLNQTPEMIEALTAHTEWGTPINTMLTSFNHAAEFLRATIIQPLAKDWLGPKIIGQEIPWEEKKIMLAATGIFTAIGFGLGWVGQKLAFNIKDEENAYHRFHGKGPTTLVMR